MLERFNRGERLTAEWVEEISRLVTQIVNGGAGPGDDIRLFRATEAFTLTAVAGVWSGDCVRVEYRLSDDTYIDFGGTEEAFCLEDAATPPANGETFYAVFNRGSGRWEKVTGGGCCCEATLGLDILTEDAGALFPVPPTSGLLLFVPAFWEFSIPDLAATPIDSVDSSADTLTLPTALEAGQEVTLNVTNGDLPSPLETDTTYYVVNPSGNDIQLAATAGGAAIDLTDDGTGEMVIEGLAGDLFRMWFRADTPPDGNKPRAISDQFAVKYHGAYRRAHFEFIITNAASELCRVQLVIDYPIRHSTADTPAVVYSAPLWNGAFTSYLFDYLSQIKLTYINRWNQLLFSTDPDLLEPLGTLQSTICLTPRKYPDSLEDETPLTQLWGGTPPATINVSLDGAAPSIIKYLLSGKLDCYGSDATAGAPGRYSLRAVMDGTEVNTSKVMLINMGAGTLTSISSKSRVMVADFAAPLDVTVTDVDGHTLRFYE